MTYGLIAVGLWLGLESTDLTPGRRSTTWLAVMVRTRFGPLSPGARPSVASCVRAPHRYRYCRWPSSCPGWMIGAPPLLLSKRVGQVLDVMPTTWLIALQLYRVFGSVFLVGALRGVLPGVFGLPAGIGDVLTGLFAVPAAIAVATGTAEAERRRSSGTSSISRTSPLRSPWG